MGGGGQDLFIYFSGLIYIPPTVSCVYNTKAQGGCLTHLGERAFRYWRLPSVASVPNLVLLAKRLTWLTSHQPGSYCMLH